MTSKTKQIIMAAIGAYLVYTGISLVQDTIVGEPKNQILFIPAHRFISFLTLHGQQHSCIDNSYVQPGKASE